MPYGGRSKCAICCEAVSPSGETHLSARGKHQECAAVKVEQNIIEQARRCGTYYTHWADSMKRAVAKLP